MVSEGRHRGESHQSLGVLLDEKVAADNHAVQPGVPSTKHRELALGLQDQLGQEGLRGRDADQAWSEEGVSDRPWSPHHY